MRTSDKGDLTGLVDDIKEVFEEHGLERPALAVAFTLAEDRQKAHWVTNMRRSDGIKLFAATAEKMQSEVN
jgi:hypothetical protein